MPGTCPIKASLLVRNEEDPVAEVAAEVAVEEDRRSKIEEDPAEVVAVLVVTGLSVVE